MTALKKKPVQLGIAVALAAGIVLAGTFAWSSFNQSRINVFNELIVPDVNLHDDFEGGPNKDVYVENSGDSPIYLRVRLTEFLQTEGRGSLMEGHVRDDDKAYLWAPHNGVDTIEACKPIAPDKVSSTWGSDNFHDYYTWLMGGQNPDNLSAQIYYKPATEEQKSGTNADGTERAPVVVSDPLTGTSTAGDASVDYAAQMAEEIPKQQAARLAELKAELIAGGMGETDAAAKAATQAEAEGLAMKALGLQKTQTAYVITMDQWISGTTGLAPGAEGYRAPYAKGEFWVIAPLDGWAYWANGLEGGTATGLLLDKVNRTDKNFDSNAEYAVNVWLQAVTEDDLGKFQTQEGGGISDNGQKLMELATGRIVLATDGSTYKNNKDGTYVLYKDKDGVEQADQVAFVPLGATEGNEVNTTEANRFSIGQRVTFGTEPDWDGADYTNWAALTTTTAPWYNLTKSSVTDAATDGGKQVYVLTNT